MNRLVNSPAALKSKENEPSFKHFEAHYSYTLFPNPQPTDIAATHLHNDYEILFFYNGDADCNIAGTIYPLKKNDMLLIKPSTFHNVTLLSPHPYERIVCNFQEEFFSPQICKILRNALPLYHIPENHPVALIFDAMKESSGITPNETFEQFFSFAIPSIIMHLPYIDNDELDKRKVTFYSTFNKILFYIDKNPDKPLTISHLSKVFYLSESHIAHLFKKNLNVSATQYINRKKITYAQSLIRSGMPPAQVAEKCSYESYPTFYRQYKKFFGVPPMKHHNQLPDDTIPTQNMDK